MSTKSLAMTVYANVLFQRPVPDQPPLAGYETGPHLIPAQSEKMNFALNCLNSP